MEQRSRTLVEVSLIQESMLSVMSYLASGWAFRLWNLTFPMNPSVLLIQQLVSENNPVMFHFSFYGVSINFFDPVGWSRRSELSFDWNVRQLCGELACHLWSSSSGWFRLTELKLFLTFQCQYRGQPAASCSFNSCSRFQSSHQAVEKREPKTKQAVESSRR